MEKFLKVFLHIIIWMLYVWLTILDTMQNYEIPSSELGFMFFKQLSFYFIFILIFYCNSYYLLPKFFFFNKYIKYIAGLLITWIVAYLLFILHGYVLYIITDEIRYFSMRLSLRIEILFYIIYFSGLSFGFRLVIEWFRYKKVAEELSRAKIALLNYQISPHFLFNTLNNIYLLV